MSKRTWQKILVSMVAIALIIPISAFATSKNKTSVAPSTAPTFENASVHDPSVIKVDETYYVFGSHLAAAKSDDLMNWKQVANGVSSDNPLFEDVVEELKETFDWAQSDTLWAADVIQLEDGKFYMYYNACKGDSPRSALGVAVADNIEGPYEDQGIILKSGMWDQTSEDGAIYDARIHPNAVDPDVFFDKEGKLWMMYGSYSGGIFIMEMDPKTGKALPGQGYGKKLLGGNHSRIEGAYVLYSPETDYYYMYLSFGGLDAVGGYNMRVVRSENPDGPYYDSEGNDMINVKADPSLPIFDDKSIEPYGVKIMGNHLFDRKIGDQGTGIGTGYVSPGHNSAYYDPETGEHFLIFHTRFPQQGEMHEIRVHQMFMNKDGWPVVAPYRYAGEQLEKVDRNEIIGDYKLINHGKDISAEIKTTVDITLAKNNKISGDVTGTWKKTDHNSAELTIDGITYNGVFLRQWDPTSESYVMTFSALSNKGTAIWGSKVPNKKDKQVVADVAADLNIGDTSAVINNIELPTEGTRDAVITWASSNQDVVTDTGIITRPEAGSESAKATLTATIQKGSETVTKEFPIVVLPGKASGEIAHYSFDGNLTDALGKMEAGTVTGNRIDNTGGAISFAEGVNGSAAVFNGDSGVKLPNGVISSNSYSVSLWLKPDQLTSFTTTFFGARDANNWLSLVPMGPVGNQTMIWSGTTWYDAVTGLTIPQGEWTHLAFTVDEGQIAVYVNGEEKFKRGGFPNVFSTTTGAFGLGVNYWDTPFKGLMDELHIYEGALTAEQISELSK
jgi:arabinan endo-1,5-alpha-L-arabinosidase